MTTPLSDRIAIVTGAGNGIGRATALALARAGAQVAAADVDKEAARMTAEAIAGAFLYNRAPYLQSFVEVRVENSQNRVRLIPHGAGGPLRWRDLDTFGALRPADQSGDDPVEFVFPMDQRPR